MKTSTSAFWKTICAAFIAAAFSPVLLFGQVSHTVTFNSSDFSFGMKGTFNVIHAKGYMMTREVGAPMLPVRIVNLVVPIGTDVGSITVDEENSEVMAGSYHIYPVQPPTLIYPDRSPNNDQAQKFVEPNQGIYNSTALYPSNPVMVESAGYFDKVVTKLVEKDFWKRNLEIENGDSHSVSGQMNNRNRKDYRHEESESNRERRISQPHG